MARHRQTKRELRYQIASLEDDLAEARDRLPLSEPTPTIDTLTICWTDRKVTFRGRTVTTESDCIAFPVTSGTNIYFRDGR